MSDRQNLAEHGVGLCLWGLGALGVGVSAQGPVAISVIAMILWDRWCRSDRKRARDALRRAEKALTDAEAAADDPDAVAEALRLMRSRRKDVRIDLGDLHRAEARTGFPDTLYAMVFRETDPPPSPAVETRLKVVIAAAYEELRKDDAFHKVYTQESLKDIERLLGQAAQNDTAILAGLEAAASQRDALLAGVEKVREDTGAMRSDLGAMRALMEELAAGRPAAGASVEALRNLAEGFGGAPETDRGGLVRFLEDKAAEHRALLEEVAALRGQGPEEDGDLTAAAEALDSFRIEEAEALLTDARARAAEALTGPLERNAALLLAQSHAARLRGRHEDAFRLLSAAADSFAALDPSEPARRRLAYASDILGPRGLRPGSDILVQGTATALRLMRSAAERADATVDTAVRADARMALIELAGRRLWSLPRDPRMAAEMEQRVAEETSVAFHEVLAARPRGTDPTGWATAHRAFGDAMAAMDQYRQESAGLGYLQEAVSAYQEAVSSFEAVGEAGFEWNLTQNSLALALSEIGRRSSSVEGRASLAKAAEVYATVLRKMSPETDPYPCAANRLHTAEVELEIAGHAATGTPAPHLEAALAHLEAAIPAFEAALNGSERATGSLFMSGKRSLAKSGLAKAERLKEDVTARLGR